MSWDDPATVRYYEEFDRRHDRYRAANQALAEHARLGPDQRVLDVGAGLGGTARAALPRLGEAGRIVCFEPAAAMRARGAELVDDPRVEWTGELPHSSFDRVLCGAAIWYEPLAEAIPRLAQRVGPGGALAFTIPSLYLGRPDEPGGGRDPLLVELPARLADGRVAEAPPGRSVPRPRDVEAILEDSGLAPEGWTFRLRLTQDALRDWLRIPVLTDALLGDLDPHERAQRVDAAYSEVDPDSWRWEGWSGWTAWRSPALAGT